MWGSAYEKNPSTPLGLRAQLNITRSNNRSYNNSKKNQPEEAMELIRDTYVDCTTKIEDINREDPRHRVNVFYEMLGDTMKIVTRAPFQSYLPNQTSAE